MGPYIGAFWLFAVVFGLSAAAHSAKKDPPKDKIVIKGCAKKKKPVEFDHPKHVAYAEKNKQDCVVCHHLVENKEPDKQKCSECHAEAKEKVGSCTDQSKSKNPFHVRCIGCHQELKSEKAPTKCNDCHQK
jgi:hypothetical protein